MTWNWQQPGWPHYRYNINGLQPLEQALLKASGVFLGVYTCLNPQDQDQLKIALLSEEALNTSAIEGEYLNRDSLQASLKRQFGLTTEKPHASAAEQGIAQMMLEVYRDYAAPLTHDTLYIWHQELMKGRTDINAGHYRTHTEPMLIVSSGRYEPTVHFEAPPSAQVPNLMQAFIDWFNQSAPAGSEPLSPLVRASITHLYFETIHPFEDGNGRIGRALAEKALAQGLGQPTLIALSTIMEHNKKAYYAALKETNHSLDITDWLNYFAKTTLQAQAQSQAQVEFLIQKARFFDSFDARINERQRKVLLRMFKEGIKGFEGGLSADNYMKIAQSTPATTTRDLQALVAMGALVKQGELRYTRYFLKLV